MKRPIARLAALSVIALGIGVMAPAASANAPTRHHDAAAVYHVRGLGFDARTTGINDFGIVVGDSGGHAFRWNAQTGDRTDLGTLGGYSSTAWGINDEGQIVGAADLAGGPSHAFLWNPRTHRMTDLGTLGGNNSSAFAINRAGVVVGESETAGGQTHAFQWNPRTHRMTDLGTLGGDYSIARAINDRGQIVGDSRTSPVAGSVGHAFLWTPCTHTMSDLGLLPHSVVSAATGINNRGDVVGYTNDVGDFTDRAFTWSARTRQMTTIPGLPDVYSHATGINDRGQIVGYLQDVEGPTATGRYAAFAWSPTTHRPTALPSLEPDSFNGAAAVNDRSWVVGQSGSAVLWIPTKH